MPAGRPKLPPELRPTVQSVRITAGTFDVIYRMASRRDMSVYAFLGGIIERVFEKQKIAHVAPPCYGADQPSSTLGAIVDVPASEGLDRDSAERSR